jgi:hypothetical protein
MTAVTKIVLMGLSGFPYQFGPLFGTREIYLVILTGQQDRFRKVLQYWGLDIQKLGQFLL